MYYHENSHSTLGEEDIQKQFTKAKQKECIQVN
jgi:hypothetical protein